MLAFPMVCQIPPLFSPPVVPFRSFPPANLLRASVPLRQPNLSPLCFHTLTNPFFRNPFLFTSMQNPRGCRGQISEAAQPFSVRSVPARPTGGPPRQIHSFHTLADSLSSRKKSSPLESTTSTLFSQNTRGGGWSTGDREREAGWHVSSLESQSGPGRLKVAGASRLLRPGAGEKQEIEPATGRMMGKVRGTVTSRTFVVTAAIC